MRGYTSKRGLAYAVACSVGLVVGALVPLASGAPTGGNRSNGVASAQTHGLPDSACRATITSTLVPGSLELCESAEVSLTMAMACPPAVPVHLVIAIDRSKSLEPELSAVRRSARDVIDELDFEGVRTQVAVLSHGFRVKVEQAFTDKESTASSALNRVRYDASDIGEDPGAAIDKAVDLLERERTGPDGQPVSPIEIVLLYGDGCDPTVPSCKAAAMRAASGAKGKGVTVATVCYETDRSNCSDYRSMATAANLAYSAPAGRLPADVRELQDGGRGVTVASASLVEALGPDVRYVLGSGRPEPEMIDDGLSFDFGSPPSSGVVTATYRIRGAAVGSLDVRVPDGGGLALTDSMGRPAPLQVLEPAVLDVTGECAVETPTPTATFTAEPTATPEASPLPSASPAPSATPTTAATATIEPGASLAYLPVAVLSVCMPQRVLNDVVLVVDTSLSMLETAGGAGSKIDAARAAAKAFLGLLEPDDRAAVVSFDATARVHAGLTADREILAAAIEGLKNSPGTRIDGALEAATAVLEDPGAMRYGARRTVVLLSDGRHGSAGTLDRVYELADELREIAVVFTVGLGDDADSDLLGAVASMPGFYVAAPTTEDLVGIYERIAAELPCPGGVVWRTAR